MHFCVRNLLFTIATIGGGDVFADICFCVCEQANSKITSWFSWFFGKIPILFLLQRAYRAFLFQWESHDTTGPLGLAVTCWPVVLSKYGRLINGCGNSKWSTSSIIGRLSVKRFALCYRTVVSLSVLSVGLTYCGQTVVWIKMKLDMEVVLGPGHIVLDWGPSSPVKGHSPQFSAHVCCGQSGWMDKGATR